MDLPDELIASLLHPSRYLRDTHRRKHILVCHNWRRVIQGGYWDHMSANMIREAWLRAKRVLDRLLWLNTKMEQAALCNKWGQVHTNFIKEAEDRDGSFEGAVYNVLCELATCTDFLETPQLFSGDVYTLGNALAKAKWTRFAWKAVCIHDDRDDFECMLGVEPEGSDSDSEAYESTEEEVNLQSRLLSMWPESRMKITPLQKRAILLHVPTHTLEDRGTGNAIV